MCFCKESWEVFRFVGRIVTLLKIIIPIVLIVIGVIALAKAVLAADDKAITSAAASLVKKAVVAVIIFFIPSIISGLFSLVDGFSDEKKCSNVCVKCIDNPGDCESIKNAYN